MNPDHNSPAALKAENELLRRELKVAREAADITAELVVKQFEETEKMLQRVQAANAAKGNFLARMSHEIRTPMNGIIGLSHLLKKTPLNPQQTGYITNILNSTETLLSLINNILDFSKIDAGKLDLEKIPFKLQEVLDNLYGIVYLQIAEKGLELDFIIAPDIPEILIGDALRLNQILLNLISNAIKFTEAGKIMVSINLDILHKHDVRLRFSVCDSGIGLPPERIEHLFKPFNQANETTTRKYGGTGLGLTICRELVEMMGGQIHAESAPGQGSDFIFTAYFGLPYSDAAAAPKNRSLANSHPAQEPESRLRGIKILLVEDNPINREIATAFLKDLGISVAVAENGRAGVKAALSNAFDLVLMDIQMPEMDGLEAARRIRRQINSRTLPIVAMTAHATNEDRHKSLEAGMNEHINKPIDPIELHRVLTDLLPEHRPSLRAPSDFDDRRKEYPAERRQPDLPAIPGLDFDEALKRTNYKPELLKRLLKDFQINFSDTAGRLKKYRSAREQTKLKELLHTLKGVTGHIGARDINRLTLALENSLESAPAEYCDKLLEQLYLQLETLLEGIAENPDLAASSPESEDKNQTAAKSCDPTATIKTLKLLQTKLSKSEHIPDSLIRQLKKIHLPPHISDNSDKIIALIEDIEYDSATDELRQLLKSLTRRH